jgi:hypothetical protein
MRVLTTARFVPFYAGRAAAWLRLKAYDEALKDCAVAIYAQVPSH